MNGVRIKIVEGEILRSGRVETVVVIKRARLKMVLNGDEGERKIKDKCCWMLWRGDRRVENEQLRNNRCVFFDIFMAGIVIPIQLRDALYCFSRDLWDDDDNRKKITPLYFNFSTQEAFNSKNLLN